MSYYGPNQSFFLKMIQISFGIFFDSVAYDPAIMFCLPNFNDVYFEPCLRSSIVQESYSRSF